MSSTSSSHVTTEVELQLQLQRDLKGVASQERLLHVTLRLLAPYFQASHAFVMSAEHQGKPRLVHRLVDAAFQGSAEGLVSTLLEGGRLSAEEVERIKAMLEKAEIEMREGGR